MKKYIVRLDEAQRGHLEDLTSKGKAPVYKTRRANILLKADVDGPAWSDVQIAEAFSVHANTVAGIRKRFAEQGLEMALNRKARSSPPRQSRFDGESEARLIALSCGEPPQGYKQWTLRLLADRAVELEFVDRVSHETVRKILKKTS